MYNEYDPRFIKNIPVILSCGSSVTVAQLSVSVGRPAEVRNVVGGFVASIKTGGINNNLSKAYVALPCVNETNSCNWGAATNRTSKSS